MTCSADEFKAPHFGQSAVEGSNNVVLSQQEKHATPR